MFPVNLSPQSSIDEQPTIGLIGMGSMGRMYAKHLSNAGWKKIHVCDRPESFEALKVEYADTPGVTVFRSGHAVSRSADWIMYSVEAEFIGKVVAEYGPSTKLGAVVAAQTSVKAPERDAFEKYLPEDVHIVSCHSLHGPTVSPIGQPLILIKHRAPEWALTLVENILRSFRSRFVYLTYEEHDLVTANTQAVTHAAFLSMGSAWASSLSYPWEHGIYVTGIETVKVNMVLRIYSNLWHVYAGLAILNPSARVQIDQYAQSTTELFKCMVRGDETALRTRMYKARDIVFGSGTSGSRPKLPILLSESVLDRFTLGNPNDDLSGVPKANSHLSILAMVDCWAQLSIQPFLHLSLAATPIFRLFLGVSEYLFDVSAPARLDAAIHAAIHDVSFRSDDLEFVVAARSWSQCVSFGSFDIYRRRFEETRKFFDGRFEEAGRAGAEMIKVVMESEVRGQGEQFREGA